jgi:hypothetical protein
VRAIGEVLGAQSGVIARRQVEAAGQTAADIERRLRRREWVRLLPGVYVDHTGEPTRLQRAWAGVLFYAPAVVADESVLSVRSGDRIVIAVDRARDVRARDGYDLRCVADLSAKSMANTSPPRMRIEDAALRVASRCDHALDAVQTLADVVRQRQTTGARLEQALLRNPKLRKRAWLGEVVRDIAAGTHSVLERAYLDRVERAHGMPAALRQSRNVGPRVRYVDAHYAAYGVEVELDGWFLHGAAEQRERDLDRDLATLTQGSVTVRLGWGHVFDRACLTAERLGALLVARGWAERPVACGPVCVVA